MKITISNKSTLHYELILLAKENLDKLIYQTKYLDAKLLNLNIFKAEYGEIFYQLYNNRLIIILGLGIKKDFLYSEYSKIFIKLIKKIRKFYIKKISINIDYIFKNIDIHKFTLSTIQSFISEFYIFDQLKTKKINYLLEAIELIYSGNKCIENEVRTGFIIANAQNYVKDLQNLPANICTTDYMLEETKKLASEYKKFEFSYLDKDDMIQLGMNCALAVGSGSKMSTYIACIKYISSNEENAPIVLVGKGIVFDSGGICIKPALNMHYMKMDMSGAAVILGVMKAVAMLDLSVNIIGIIGLAENALDAKSYRPGDIIKSMKGITVEVSNTDAEGRLILCDLLTYVGKYKPKTVINLATLTGAIIISLGNAFSGMFSNSNKLADSIEKAGIASNDLVWRLPLYEPYIKKIESQFADINNCSSDQSASSITAALFLSKFAENYIWAHLDISGSAMGDFTTYKASGRPVPLLINYLMSQ